MKKHTFLYILLSILLITGCTTTHTSKDIEHDKEKVTEEHKLHFTLHVSGPEVMDAVSPIFSDYNIAGSNWKVRDTNSLYLRFSRDQSSDDPSLFPAYSHEKLEQLTEEKGIVYWMEYPSRMWVSARNADILREAWNTNSEFRTMVDQLAHNPYQKNSWYNMEGKAQNFNFELYGEEKKKFDRQNESELGVYDSQQIDYSKPEKYLEPGPQTVLNQKVSGFIHSELDHIPNGIEGALQVQEWFTDHFSSGGIDDPRLTANDFIQLRKFSGCTEAALILSAVLREMGYPSVYIITVDVPTARTSELGRGISRGHQMVEVFADGKWILLDDWGAYTDEYDPRNPYIVRQYKDGSLDKGFVLSKGRDAWESGLLGDEYYTEMCDNFIHDLRNGHLYQYLENPAKYKMERY